MNYIKSAVRKGLRSMGYEIIPYIPNNNEKLSQLNTWQEAFCDWNSERLGISSNESRSRFRQSRNAISNGHDGDEFRQFCDLSHQIYSVFFDDSLNEIYDAYQFHGLMHFLRMLSYPTPSWAADHPILQNLSCHSRVRIIDFGCGLAQTSISLAQAFQARNVDVSILLTDIPTLRMEFLAWFCKMQNIPCELSACTERDPIPDFPLSDVFIAREVFEHLHNPFPYIEKMDLSLKAGGFLLTNVKDHQAEFMHVTPNLEAIRLRLAELNYNEISQFQLYRKEMANADCQ